MHSLKHLRITSWILTHTLQHTFTHRHMYKHTHLFLSEQTSLSMMAKDVEIIWEPDRPESHTHRHTHRGSYTSTHTHTRTHTDFSERWCCSELFCVTSVTSRWLTFLLLTHQWYESLSSLFVFVSSLPLSSSDPLVFLPIICLPTSFSLTISVSFTLPFMVLFPSISLYPFSPSPFLSDSPSLTLHCYSLLPSSSFLNPSPPLSLSLSVPLFSL